MTSYVLLGTGVEIAFAVMALISIGASIAAAYLINPDMPAPDSVQQEAPSTTSMRGSFIPYIMGRRRTGAVIGYVGGRHTTEEDVGTSASKGGRRAKNPKQTIYHENGWHLICVGPVVRIHAIYEDGKPILSGGFTPTTHPNGSTINLGDSAFVIYWGDEDQPLGAEVYAATGINSRWPLCCYVFWTTKRLGMAARWPIIDYEVEVPMHSVHLLNSPGNTTPGFTVGTTYSMNLTPLGNLPRTAQIAYKGPLPRSETPLGARITVVADNDSALDGTYTIHKVEYLLVGSVNFTFITLEEPMPDATVGPTQPNDTGDVTLVFSSSEDGANHAHMLAQLLWDPWPQGLGFPKSLFDLDYFEEAGEVMDSEGVNGSYKAESGRTALTIVGHILQDMGALLSWNVSTGKYMLKIVRDEASGAVIPEQLVLEPLPKIQTVHGYFGGSSPKADKVLFEFADRTKSYRTMTLVVDDDGRASREDRSHARKVRMPTINDFVSAGVVVERRAQEDLAKGAVYTVNVNREARQLFPGQVVTVSGIVPLLRIMAVTIDPYSGKTVLDCVTDFYGAKKSTYPWLSLEQNMTGGGGPYEVPPSTYQEEDPLSASMVTSTSVTSRVYEVPGHLVPYPSVSLVLPRLRRSSKTPAAAIHISSDDVTYRALALDRRVQTGGELTEQFLSTEAWVTETGPTFDVLGGDIALVEDLTGDNANWYVGRQLAVINDEIFFLRNITALGGSSYRLNGLVRARFDSVRATHAIGDMVNIFKHDSILVWSDYLVKPGNTIYVKVQPVGGIGEVDLDEIATFTHVVEGKGIAPMVPGALRTLNNRSSWTELADVFLEWGYRSTEYPGTGAGMQGAGTPSGSSAVQGTFVLDFYTSGGTWKASYTSLVPSYTYAQDDIWTDFVTEPTKMVVKVSHIQGGLASSKVSLSLTRE